MRPLIIGIAGGTASGKTSVTNKIVESFDKSMVLVIAHDSYYRDISTFQNLSIDDINFDHPDSLETSLLVQHLQQLRDGRAADQPLYDFAAYTRIPKTVRLLPAPIIIVEGILIFVEKDLRDIMDIRIFIDTDADERLVRRMKRDIQERGRSIDSIMTQYIRSVKPMHHQFVEPSKHWADIIIPRGADNLVAIDIVVTKIKSLMEERRSQP